LRRLPLASRGDVLAVDHEDFLEVTDPHTVRRGIDILARSADDATFAPQLSIQTGFDIPIHDQAWVVTFSGQWHLLCEGGCDPTTEGVAIDYSTGEWIASQYSFPQRRQGSRRQAMAVKARGGH